jgi:hypothetical protein
MRSSRRLSRSLQRLVRIPWAFSGLLVLLTLVGHYHLTSIPAPAAQDITDLAVETVYFTPVPVGVTAATPTPQLSAEQREALLMRKLELREQWAARVDSNPPSPPGLPLVAESEAQVRELEAPLQGAPADIVIRRNNFNPRANSNLAEPVAVNNAVLVFFAGNTHAEFSMDGGVSWTDDSPSNDGPSKAPNACCDNDIVMDSARRVAFWSVLYRHPTNPTGIVRLYVRHNLAVSDCFYNFDPGDIPGTPMIDIDTGRPRLGLTKNFLWLATAEAHPSFPGGQRARMYRIPIDPLVACEAFSSQVVTWPASRVGARVWAPVEGANLGTTMYWGHLDNTTTFRIFSWPEAAAPTNVTRRISPSTFGDPDCRGGVGNFNFIQGFVPTSIT